MEFFIQRGLIVVFYNPRDAWAGDFIPFFWEGSYHLFYLKDYRDEEEHGEGTPWFHLSTEDFLHFKEWGEALPRGGKEEQDLYVFTGCVYEKDGVFNIFYTGHNPHYEEEGRPVQAVMRATSADLKNWEKDPANPILLPDQERYEANDWRDPFVFWNEQAGEYWMLLAARTREGPENRRGCIALATSPDLEEWEVKDPFWAPNLYYTHECPDLFKMGDWWYLLYSTFSERHITHYRMSKSLDGPWLAPTNDSFDSRAFYAAKTASDGERRFAFAWNPTREGEVDDGDWQWGGSLVTHELVQTEEGHLLTRPPVEVEENFTKEVSLDLEPRLGDWAVSEGELSVEARDSFAWSKLGEMPDPCEIKATLNWEEGTRYCGLLLRADEELENYYQVRLEPGRDRIVFDRWPRPGDEPFILERPLPLEDEGAVELTVFVEGSVIEIYADDQVALSARGYEHSQGSCGLFLSEGECRFTNLQINKQ